MLKLEGVHTSYGAIRALHGISLEVRDGEIVALLGANGAGKTTTLKTISGQLHPHAGTIEFDGASVVGQEPEAIVARGVSHVPEGRHVFPGLTVIDNLRLGATVRRAKRAEVDADLESVLSLFPKLRTLLDKYGWTLSGGEQQMLAIARGLMARPKLLLLDEPSLGLAPLIVSEVMRTIKRIASEGTTVLLVEQNAHLALMIANRAYVLETGKVALSGPASELLESEEMHRAYLGSAVHHSATS